MAATLHIVPSNTFSKRKRLHGELDIGAINNDFSYKKRLKHQSGKYTPPPSSSESSGINFPAGDSLDAGSLDNTAYTYFNRDINSVLPSAEPDLQDQNHDKLTPKKKSTNKKQTKVKLLIDVNLSSDTGHSDAIEENPDYIALCSTLNMLYKQRQKAQNDIVELSKLKKQLKQKPLELQALLSGDNKLANKIPSRNQIVKCPTIDFTKYGIAYEEEQNYINQQLDCNKPESLFKVSSLFG